MKKTLGFKVIINDELTCRAGIDGEDSVVTCILNSLRRGRDESEDIEISVGGLNSETGQYVDWCQNKLHEGDKITIELISDNFDKPSAIREPKAKKDLLAEKLEHYHRLKEELKDHLKE